MLAVPIAAGVLLLLSASSAQAGLAQAIPQEVSLSVGDATVVVPSEELLTWFDLHPSIVFAPGHKDEIGDPSHCPSVFPFLCELLLTRQERRTLKTVTTYSIDESPLRTSLERIGQETAVVPQDAKFAIQNGRVTAFAQSKDGRSLDVDQAVRALSDALLSDSIRSSAPVTLPVRDVPAAVRDTDATKLGIVELISEGRTNWAGSPRNRIHNFTLGAAQFNGLLIAPGEEFSFVEHLGPVDAEHGYLPELVIKHDKTEPEFGGGICQVSTTMFRAALYAGLEITARRNHAYPVSYYKPYGMDATIYIPRPDLRFVNNTPGNILVQTAIEGQDLVFRFYGTPDGRTASIDGPHILERGSDGSMKTVFTQTVTAADGKTLIDDKFYSNYASPSKYPHPGQEPVYTSKPDGWSEKQWSEYRRSRS